MLQTIRDRSQGVIVGVIVFLISLTFALWGIQSYIGAGSEVVVAEAAGEEILLTEFQDSLQRMRRQAQAVLGDRYDASMWDDPATRRRALDELIDARLLEQLTDDVRIRISDVQVAQQIQQIPSFRDEDGFSRALYLQRVPQLGFTQAGFEKRLRDDMMSAQIRAGISASEFVTREEAVRVQRLREQTRDIGYAIIPASTFADDIAITDDELRAYFDANSEAFRVEEEVRLEYLQISAQALADEVRVTEQALRDFYEANKANYTVSEERNANHILISVPQSASDAEQAEALARLEVARTRAASGEDFEDIAKELSDDVGTRADGGETGLFPRGVMAPEFEEAAFSLAVGEISKPVRTKFGYHLIKLKEIQPGGTKSFDEVRGQVETAYRESEAQKLFFERAEQFSNLVYEHPDGLEVAAEALGLEIRRTDLLPQMMLVGLFSERVATAAFEPEVLVEGLNAEPIELPDGRVVAIRVTEHVPTHIPAFEDVRADVESALRQDKLRERTREVADEMLTALREGGSVDEVVSARDFGWESVTAARRDSDDVNRAVLRAAFKADLEGEGPVFIGAPIGQSDYAVVRIANLQVPAIAEVDKSDVRAVQAELYSPRAQTVWRDFLLSLRADSSVRVFEENL